MGFTCRIKTKQNSPVCIQNLSVLKLLVIHICQSPIICNSHVSKEDKTITPTQAKALKPLMTVSTLWAMSQKITWFHFPNTTHVPGPFLLCLKSFYFMRTLSPSSSSSKSLQCVEAGGLNRIVWEISVWDKLTGISHVSHTWNDKNEDDDLTLREGVHMKKKRF